MASATCFVIMPIGDQAFVGGTVSAGELKQRYDNLIKEALLKAKPDLEVVRADEVSLPGTITSDILMRLMHSNFVLADVTYPNPNVFYELGLRHACRVGTIIIRDKAGPRVPFDIAHLRHIEYENTPTGLKALSDRLQVYFELAARNPDHPDNHLQELAKLTNYKFHDYAAPEEVDPEQQAMLALVRAPEALDIFMRKARGEEIDQGEIAKIILSNPELAGLMVKAIMRPGQLAGTGVGKKAKTANAGGPNRKQRRATKKRKRP